MIDANRIRKLMDDEDAFFAQYSHRTFWEDYEMDLLKSEARELYNARIISVVYRSRTTTGYRVNKRIASEYITHQEGLNVTYPAEKSIPANLFDSIVGYDDVKERFKLIIAGDTPTGVLMVGPPASAKSMFLLELSRLPQSRYITASSATKSGLVDILLTDEPQILMIDELDKANHRDFDAILSLLESGIVQRNQHSLHIQKVLKTKVFAACNRDNSLPPEIMSRFIRLRFHPYSEQELREIGYAILTRREHISPEVASYIVTAVLNTLGMVDPREFIKVARLRGGNTMHDIQETVNFMKKYS